MSDRYQELTKYRLFLLPILISIGIIFSTVFFLKTKIEQISGLRANLTQQKTQLAELTKKLTVLGGLDASELETKTNIVLKALPAEKDVPRVLLTIKGLSQTTGLNLESIKVEPGEISTQSAQAKETQKYNLSFLNFQVMLVGTLEQIRVFLAKIESVAPLMRIDKLEISQTKEGITEATLNVDAFFLPLPASLGLTEKQLLPMTIHEEKNYQKLSKLESIQSAQLEESLPAVVSGKTNPFSL